MQGTGEKGREVYNRDESLIPPWDGSLGGFVSERKSILLLGDTGLAQRLGVGHSR